MSKSFNLHGVGEISHTFLKNETVGQLSATDFKLGIKGANDKFSIQGAIGLGPAKLINESMPQLGNNTSFSGNIKSHYQINKKYGVSIYLDGRYYDNGYKNVSKERVDDGQQLIDSNTTWEYIYNNYHLSSEEVEAIDSYAYNFFNSLDNNPVEIKTYRQTEEYYGQSVKVASVGAEVDRSVKNFNFGVGLEGRYMKSYEHKTNVDQTVKCDPLNGNKLVSYNVQSDENKNNKFSMTPTARVSYNIPLFGGNCEAGLNLNVKKDQATIGGTFTF